MSVSLDEHRLGGLRWIVLRGQDLEAFLALGEHTRDEIDRRVIQGAEVFQAIAVMKLVEREAALVVRGHAAATVRARDVESPRPQFVRV